MATALAVSIVAKAVTSLVASAINVREFSKNVQVNRAQCELLAGRIEQISALTAMMLERGDLVTVYNIEATLADLADAVDRAQELMREFGAKSKWHQKLLSTGSFRSAFEDVNARLSSILQHLDVTIALSTVFNPADDTAAEASDLASIRESLDAIVTMHAEDRKLLSSIYSRQRDLEANLVQSLRDHLHATVVAPHAQPPADKYQHLEIPFWQLCFEEQIGRGGFGTVYRGVYQGESVAIKQLDVDRLGAVALKEFKNEIDVLSRITSRYIPRLYGICSEHGRYCIVMEYMPRGNLSEVLRDSDTELPWFLRYRMALESAKAMQLLYANGIQHRDFKSLNVLLDDYLHCKVSDFGLSKSRTTMQTTSHALGNANERAMATLAWTAPERLKIGSRFTDKCDVYSFGVTLYEIASRSLPFEGEEALVIRMSILEGARPEIPDDAPEAFAALICECWAQEARLRPGFEEITRRLEILYNSEIDATATAPTPLSAAAALEPTLQRKRSLHMSGSGNSVNDSAHVLSMPLSVMSDWEPTAPPMPPMPPTMAPRMSPSPLMAFSPLAPSSPLMAPSSGSQFLFVPPMAPPMRAGSPAMPPSPLLGAARAQRSPAAIAATSNSSSMRDMYSGFPTEWTDDAAVDATDGGGTGHNATEKAKILRAMSMRSASSSHRSASGDPAAATWDAPPMESSLADSGMPTNSMNPEQTAVLMDKAAAAALMRSSSALSTESTVSSTSTSATLSHAGNGGEQVVTKLDGIALAAEDSGHVGSDSTGEKQPLEQPEVGEMQLQSSLHADGSPLLFPPPGATVTVDVAPIAAGPRFLAFEAAEAGVFPLPTPASIYERGYIWATPANPTRDGDREGFVPLYTCRTVDCEREMSAFVTHSTPIVAHALDEGIHHPVFVAGRDCQLHYFQLPSTEFERPLALDVSTMHTQSVPRPVSAEYSDLLAGWNRGSFALGYIPRSGALYMVGGGKFGRHGATRLDLGAMRSTVIDAPFRDWHGPSVIHADGTLFAGGGGPSRRRFARYDPRARTPWATLAKFVHSTERLGVPRFCFDATAQQVIKLTTGIELGAAMRSAEVYDIRGARWAPLNSVVPGLVASSDVSGSGDEEYASISPTSDGMGETYLRGMAMHRVWMPDGDTGERMLVLDTTSGGTRDATAAVTTPQSASSAISSLASNLMQLGRSAATSPTSSSPSSPLSGGSGGGSAAVQDWTTLWDMKRDRLVRSHALPPSGAHLEAQVLCGHAPYSGLLSVGRDPSGLAFVQSVRWGPPMSMSSDN